MDTRFWGPPAWVLLHSLAQIYEPNKKEYYKLFFGNLKYVLPCIYCRASFTEYCEKLPMDNYLASQSEFFEWLYKIHNMVNDKLRGQGLIKWENPPLSQIVRKYEDLVSGINSCRTRDQNIMGWNFLYCIAFVYPEDGLKTVQTSHYHGYITFFNMLAQILPEQSGIRKAYSQYLNDNPIVSALDCRETLKGWIYRLEQYMDIQLNHQCSSFNEIENLIESYRAGCGGIKKDTKPTCRRIDIRENNINKK